MNEHTYRLGRLAAETARELAKAARDPLPDRIRIVRLLLDAAIAAADFPPPPPFAPDHDTMIRERENALDVFCARAATNLARTVVPVGSAQHRAMEAHVLRHHYRLGYEESLFASPGVVQATVWNFVGLRFMRSVQIFDRDAFRATMQRMKKIHLMSLCTMLESKMQGVEYAEYMSRSVHSKVRRHFSFQSDSTKAWLVETVVGLLRRLVMETANTTYPSLATRYARIVRTVAVLLGVVRRNHVQRDTRKAARAPKRKRN